MTGGCIICANGNDLPDGEHCRACGREGLAVGLRAAVIKARGRQEPPTEPVKFSCQDCGGLVSDDGYSIDDQKCCFRCQP